MPKKTKEKAEEVSKKTEKISEKDFEKKVFELAEKGLTSEKIGEALRKEGIHSKEFGKKISKILGSKYSNPDVKNIEEKLGKLIKHFEKNHGDKRAMREKERTAAKLGRLKKYLAKRN
ncbi:30S ribosomal protein S15 [uncultured archaeon]|nr:30S ribosomal protein S15 [uncultured archaeon]